MQYIPCNSALLAQETLFLTKKAFFLPKDLQKVRISRQILIRHKIAYVRAKIFCPSPNFSAGATCAPVQLLPTCSPERVFSKIFFHFQTLLPLSNYFLLPLRKEQFPKYLSTFKPTHSTVLFSTMRFNKDNRCNHYRSKPIF